jgi:hypothetical protein
VEGGPPRPPPRGVGRRGGVRRDVAPARSARVEERTRLRLLDADGAPLAGRLVTLAPAGDVLPSGAGEQPIALTSDAEGYVEFAPFRTTHARVVFEGGLRPVGGAFVPDTCRSATLRIPVRGTTRLVVTLPKGRVAPEAIVAEHPGALFFPDRRTPKTLLRRVSALDLADGRTLALYSAPFRTDVPSSAVLRLPEKTWGLDRLHLALGPDTTGRLDLSK